MPSAVTQNHDLHEKCPAALARIIASPAVSLGVIVEGAPIQRNDLNIEYCRYIWSLAAKTDAAKMSLLKGGCSTLHVPPPTGPFLFLVFFFFVLLLPTPFCLCRVALSLCQTLWKKNHQNVQVGRLYQRLCVNVAF